MRERLRGLAAPAALVISMLSLLLSASGFADAAKSTTKAHKHATTKRKKKLSGGAIDATTLQGQTPQQIEGSCPPVAVDLGSWCLESAPYPLKNSDAGKNDYFFASQTCVAQGGWLPTAAQLIGAAKRVQLASTIHDSPLTAYVDQDPSSGLKDYREMSSTLVTTAAGSDAAGSEGVSDGSTGDPKQNQPNPTPQPADPTPETLQYVTVYSNAQKGGFAGSEPVSHPELFRCAFNKTPGAVTQNASG